MQANIGALKLICFTFTINKITWNNGRILLCPGNNIHLGIFLFIKSFGQRSVVIGNSAFKLWPRAKTYDFFSCQQLYFRRQS